MTAELIAGRYALCDPIGAGGSGTVWRAFDRTLNLYCAAKLLRQRDAGELLRFAREQSVRLHDHNIVSPYAWAADDGMVLIASELIDGGSLQVLLGDYGALAEETVVQILDQVLSALQAVHTAELIHRDVKPGNLLLRATGDGPLQVMLADFGLTISRRDARLTAVGMVIGTPGYLPPEVLVGGGVSPEPAHDMYAVGRLALTLLAGHEVPTAAQGDIPIADANLRDAVRSMLAADPGARPSSASIARSLLGGVQRSATPRTRDGDPITVLDQLPALPDGWDQDGEVAGRGATKGVRSAQGVRATLVESVLPAEPEPATGRPVQDAASAGRGGGSAQPANSAPVPVGTTVASDDGERMVAKQAPILGAGSAASRPPTEQSGRQIRRVGVGGIIGVLLVAVIGFVLSRNGDDPQGGGTGTPASSVSSPTPASSSPPPASSAAVTTDAALRAGDDCGWQIEGDRRNTADGELVCAVDAGAYRWVLAPG